MGTICAVEKSESESSHVIVHRQSPHQDKEQVVNVHVTVLKTVNIHIAPSSEAHTDVQDRAEVIGERTKVIGDETNVTGETTEVTGNKTEVTADRTEVTGDRTKVTGDRTEVTGDRTKVTGDRTEVINDQTNNEVSVTMTTTPLRTVSVIRQEERDALIKEHPELRETLAKIKSLGEDKFFTSKADDGDFEEPDLKDLLKCLTDTLSSSWKEFDKPDQRKLIGSTMVDTGLLDDMIDCYEILAEFTEPNLADKCLEAYILIDIRKILWNFSDLSEAMRNAIAQRKNMLSILAMDLRDLSSDDLLDTVNKDNFRFTSAVGILNNCSRGDTAKSEYIVTIHNKKKHIIHVLFPFTDHKDEYVKLITLLVLSRLVQEKENKLLETKIYLFEFLLNKIKEAMGSADRRWHGFSVDELVDGLAHLAKNEKNKTTIMDKGAFGILKEILTTSESDDEKLATIHAIWELSYEEKYKQLFKRDEDITEALRHLSSSPKKALHDSATWTCFEIGISSVKKVKEDIKQELKKDIVATTSAAEEDVKGHIMISYNWGSQPILIKVYKRLVSEGFKVWMDIHDIRKKGDLLDAMSDAVENSSVVLICYSEKYKNSKNCRTEAKYAYDLLGKLEIMALKMQKNYKPDGWLGAMIAGQLWYDLSSDQRFEDQLQELIQTLHEKIGNWKSKESTTPARVKTNDQINKSKIMQWQQAEVTTWLESSGLDKFNGIKDTSLTLTGEQLVFLCELYKRAPEFFYRCLKDELQLRGLEELKQFNNAIRKLFEQYPELYDICV